MAEEQPYFDGQKLPHEIEAGAFTLDLYRLICMVSAEPEVANLGLTSYAIARLQQTYVRSEVTRILISCAASLRIMFDQSPRGSTIEPKSDCGKLFPNWATDPNKVEVLRLREDHPCN
jgi:hypothetical protein